MADQLRRSLAVLVQEAETDLQVVWNSTTTPEQAASALHDVLPALINQYGQAAAAVAAEWYDNLRASQGIPGSFTAMPEDIPDPGGNELVGWATATAQDTTSMQSLVVGGMTRRILNFSRGTVTSNSVADKHARGWQRVGSGECSFCAMLISRGAVYTEATADFAAHDHCECSATPAWVDRPNPVQPYTPSSRDISDADRARVRAWIGSH